MRFFAPEEFAFELGTAKHPIATINPGEKIKVFTQDSRSGYLRRPEDVFTSVPKAVGDNPMVNPATGPFYIQGAEIGDTLVVEILDIALAKQGYLMAKQGQGILKDKMQKTVARIVKVDGNICHFSPEISFPVRPMVGVVGTAPQGKPVPTIHVGDTGGNMDNHRITTGTKVFLPIQVSGAYLFIGDVHAAMGDGEISGTALEIQSEVSLLVNVIKNQSTPLPYLETAEHLITTGHGPSVEAAAYQAVKDMAQRLMEPLNLDWEEVMMLLSAISDLRICQSCGHPLEATVRLEIPKNMVLNR